MRLSVLLTCCRNPSWVWLNEVALPMLPFAALVRAIWAVNFIDTAKPSASSAGETILEPEDRRAMDMFNRLVELANSRALFKAATFVLMTILDSFHESPLAGLLLHGIPAARRVFPGHPPDFPAGPSRLPAAGLATPIVSARRRKTLAVSAKSLVPGCPDAGPALGGHSGTGEQAAPEQSSVPETTCR